MCAGVASGAAAAGPDVDGDGGDDQDALDDVLPVGGDDEQVEAVVQGLDEQQAECGAPDGAAAAEQAGAADDDGGDGVEFVALSEVGWRLARWWWMGQGVWMS